MTKKIISTLLVTIMLVSCMSLMGVAASLDVPTSIGSNTTLNASSTYIIPQGATVTIAEGATLTIPKSTTVTNYGTLTNNGTINGTVVSVGYGKILHRVKVTGGVSGVYSAYYFNRDYISGDDYYNPEFKIDLYYDKIEDGTVPEYIYAIQGKPFYFTYIFVDKMYDVQKLSPTANGVGVSYLNGVFCVPDVTNSMLITCADHLQKDLRKDITIPLPQDIEEFSYRVVAYYGGKQYDNEVKIKYGDSFVFKLDLDPLYDRSRATVTMGGKQLKANENGFYESPVITDANGDAANAYEIIVMGVTDNDSQLRLAGIVGMIQDIIKTILDVFRTFIAMLGLDVVVPEV